MPCALSKFYWLYVHTYILLSDQFNLQSFATHIHTYMHTYIKYRQVVTHYWKINSKMIRSYCPVEKGKRKKKIIIITRFPLKIRFTAKKKSANCFSIFLISMKWDRQKFWLLFTERFFFFICCNENSFQPRKIPSFFFFSFFQLLSHLYICTNNLNNLLFL